MFRSSKGGNPKSPYEVGANSLLSIHLSTNQGIDPRDAPETYENRGYASKTRSLN